MTFKSISAHDPWNDKCPDPRALSAQELLCFVEDWAHASLAEYEAQFCASLCERLKSGKMLTDKQYEFLSRRNLFVRLWDADPALWETGNGAL